MAITKSAKIEAEIEKVKAKIAEQQARLKELEQKKLEAENSEIVEIVRGMSISLADLPLVLLHAGCGQIRRSVPDVGLRFDNRQRTPSLLPALLRAGLNIFLKLNGGLYRSPFSVRNFAGISRSCKCFI